MTLIDEAAWDAYASKKSGNIQYTYSAHDWAPAGRYLKIESLSTSVYSTDNNFLSGGGAHIHSYWRRTGGNFDQQIFIPSPWNYEAWDYTMTGVVWYIQVNRGFVAYRLNIGLWA